MSSAVAGTLRSSRSSALNQIAPAGCDRSGHALSSWPRSPSERRASQPSPSNAPRSRVVLTVTCGGSVCTNVMELIPSGPDPEPWISAGRPGTA